MGSGSWSLHLLATILVLCSLSTVPDFIKAFHKLHLDIPPATRLIFELSQLAANYWHLLVVLIALDGILLLSLNLAPARWHRLARAWSALVLFSSIYFLATIILSLSLAIHDSTLVFASDAPESNAAESAGLDSRTLDSKPAQSSAEQTIQDESMR